MEKLLSIVEDVFELSGRPSVVIVPGVPRAGDCRLKVGDPLKLRRPDGTEASTFVGGLELTSPPSTTSIALMLGPSMTKADVPIGTEVWLL